MAGKSNKNRRVYGNKDTGEYTTIANRKKIAAKHKTYLKNGGLKRQSAKKTATKWNWW